MDKYIDLHLHTTASDGTSEPTEVVKLAQKNEFSAIAITDHDTISGLEEALAAGKEYGVEVIPGIELNTDYKDSEAHILGYFIDYNAKILLDKLASLKEARYNRIKRMIKKLKDINIDVKFSRVKEVAGDAPLGRAHLAQVILDEGYESDWGRVFDKYIGRQAPGYVEREKMGPAGAIKLIKEIGGIPIVAHPALINNDQYLQEIIDFGAQGLEIYHTEHTKEDIYRYLEIAKDEELLITGGSDCHGEKRKEGQLLGQVKAPYYLLKKLKDAKNSQ